MQVRGVERDDSVGTAQESTVHVDLYARLAQESRGERAPWLDALRRAAMTRFEQVGFPSKTQEEWRFTDISPITKTQFKLAERVP
jgi:Fe-S cluster assembly protein SufD